MHTVIIGGGIGGLAAAHRLRMLGGQRVTMLEGGERWGGVIETVQRDDLCLEFGPDAVVTTKPAALALIRELGLAEDIIGVAPAARRAFIARGNGLVPVPDGLYLLAPARLWSFACSPLVSWPGKLRMALDLLLPRRAAHAPEESLGAFVRRRLGREALARIAQPLVSGIYSADPDRLSLAATMPQFLAMEQEHRSLILALRARGRAAAEQGSGPRYGLFATLRGGMQGLIHALIARLDGCDLRLHSAATALSRRGDGWVVETAGGPIVADAVVLALPAHAAAGLLAPVDATLAGELRAIPYAGIATVNLVISPDQVPRLPAGAGFVVPAIEGRVTLACTIASMKFPHRAPADRVVLRACAGGAQRASDLALDDAALVAAIVADLRDLVGLRGEPRLVTVRRWPAALPQYLVGHQARVARIRAAESALPSLALVGNAYEGTGIPDVIATAENAVRRLLDPTQVMAAEGA